MSQKLNKCLKTGELILLKTLYNTKLYTQKHLHIAKLTDQIYNEIKQYIDRIKYYVHTEQNVWKVNVTTNYMILSFCYVNNYTFIASYNKKSR